MRLPPPVPRPFAVCSRLLPAVRTPGVWSWQHLCLLRFRFLHGNKDSRPALSDKNMRATVKFLVAVVESKNKQVKIILIVLFNPSYQIAFQFVINIKIGMRYFPFVLAPRTRSPVCILRSQGISVWTCPISSAQQPREARGCRRAAQVSTVSKGVRLSKNSDCTCV